MSEPAKQPPENTEVMRKLVVPPESQVEPKEGDRSPTETERDLKTEVPADADAATPAEVEVIRERVVPEKQSESEEGDRGPTTTERMSKQEKQPQDSPTQTDRDLNVKAIAKTPGEPTQTNETVRKLVVPEE